MRDPSLDDSSPQAALGPSAYTPLAVPAPDPRDRRLAVLLGAAAASAPTAGRPAAGPDDALRDAVCAVVRRLKDEGLAPERALAAVKAHVHRAVGPYADDDPAGDLMARVVGWCIAAYYRAD